MERGQSWAFQTNSERAARKSAGKRKATQSRERGKSFGNQKRDKKKGYEDEMTAGSALSGLHTFDVTGLEGWGMWGVRT